jgi:hypothetical protein
MDVYYPHTLGYTGSSKKQCEELASVALACFGLSYFLLFLYRDLADSCCMPFVLST